jgi:hypothetical protein
MVEIVDNTQWIVAHHLISTMYYPRFITFPYSSSILESIRSSVFL